MLTFPSAKELPSAFFLEHAQSQAVQDVEFARMCKILEPFAGSWIATWLMQFNKIGSPTDFVVPMDMLVFPFPFSVQFSGPASQDHVFLQCSEREREREREREKKRDTTSR